MSYYKARNFQGEAQAEGTFGHYAPLKKCAYFKIPDAIKTKDSLIRKENGTYTMVEDQRPFDGILVTPVGNFCIEWKYNKGKLKDHQEENLVKVKQINNMYYILRRTDKKNKAGIIYEVGYTVEDINKNILFSTLNILEIFDYIIKENKVSEKNQLT